MNLFTNFKKYLLQFSDKTEFGKRKRTRMNFDNCQVVDESKIDQSLVQLSVDHEEVQRRIRSFIESKREEINRNNQRDFIADGEINDSCARVASNVYRIEDSKGHLKIKIVCNEAGPGSSNTDKETLNQFYGIEERVKDVEDFIGVEVP